MKKVKILSRNFTYGSKLYGQDGEYLMDDKLADQLEAQGKVSVLATGKKALEESEDKPLVSGVQKQEFLNLVRENAQEINNILKNEHTTKMANTGGEAGVVGHDAGLAKGGRKTKEGAATDAGEPVDTTNTEDSDSDESDSDDDEEDEVNGPKAKDAVETPIPDGFPAKAALAKAGFTTLESIPRDKNVLHKKGFTARQINSIGSKLAEE
jgi:hypothetical protein